MKAKVLIIGKNYPDFSSAKTQLEQDFECLDVQNTLTIEAVLQSWVPQVILLCKGDENLDCLQLIQAIYKDSTSAKPGIIVLAEHYSLHDEMKSFAEGCDHFLLWKSPLQSIVSRIKSCSQKYAELQRILKQHSLSTLHVPRQPILKGTPDCIIYENIKVWPEKNMVKMNDQVIHLTPIQFKLVLSFVSNVEELLTREWLKVKVWNNKDISLRSVDAHITKLKKQLPAFENAIQNIYGKGYRLRSPRQSAA